ncbi:MAG: acylphosphatase [Balneolaceae bacterium]
MIKHVFISGNVQGVGYRHFTRKNAESLGVTGWVKNLSDGRVEAVFEGEPDQVKQMLERCKKGPISSSVKKIEEIGTNSEPESYPAFEVR